VTVERGRDDDFEYRARHDPLTGLANAQGFNDFLRAEAAAADSDQQVGPRGTATLFIDLDDFRIVNDTFGRDVGDQLLVEVGRRIESCLGPDDLAARFGADDFAAILPNVANARAARAVAQAVADTFATPAVVDGVTVDCQASIGLAYAQGRGQLDSLLREADTALYTVKSRGKGHWRQFREGMPAPTRRRIDERRRLEDALRSSALEVQYQPIVDVVSGEAAGFEALLRLPDADPPVSPQQAIQMAEDTGMITAIGDRVLLDALHAIVEFNPPGSPTPRYVSVNVSARQLRQPDFVDTVHSHLATTGADPTLLVLEITENLLVNDDDRAWGFLARLREEGVRVAIDDYGTGYASLNYLRQPVIDIVKVDKSFLNDPTSLRGRTLLRAITSLCRDLELNQIAEGVRDVASREAVLDAGCRYGQGFLYARAMPLSAAKDWRRAPA
jgi:diguanylate cyclase (GGDEF)-like protein